MSRSERGEARPLPEMPRRERHQIEKWVGSDNPENWGRAIRRLEESDAYGDVPVLVRQALRRGIDFDSIMRGMKTLSEFGERFGVDAKLSQDNLGYLLGSLDPYRDLRQGQLLGWGEKTGRWGLDVYLGLFDLFLRRGGMEDEEMCADYYLGWFSRMRGEFSEEEAQRAVSKLTEGVFLERIYIYLHTRRNIAVILADYPGSVEAVLERVGQVRPEDTKPWGFWEGVEVLCRTRDVRTSKFLIDRLLDSRGREMLRTGNPENIQEALLAMSSDFDSGTLMRLIENCADSDAGGEVWEVLKQVNRDALIRAEGDLRRLSEEIDRGRKLEIAWVVKRVLERIERGD